jgi:hypothetical protein
LIQCSEVACDCNRKTGYSDSVYHIYRGTSTIEYAIYICESFTITTSFIQIFNYHVLLIVLLFITQISKLFLLSLIKSLFLKYFLIVHELLLIDKLFPHYLCQLFFCVYKCCSQRSMNFRT